MCQDDKGPDAPFCVKKVLHCIDRYVDGCYGRKSLLKDRKKKKKMGKKVRWMEGWVGGSKSRVKDCLQQSKKIKKNSKWTFCWILSCWSQIQRSWVQIVVGLMQRELKNITGQLSSPIFVIQANGGYQRGLLVLKMQH